MSYPGVTVHHAAYAIRAIPTTLSTSPIRRGWAMSTQTAPMATAMNSTPTSDEMGDTSMPRVYVHDLNRRPHAPRRLLAPDARD